MILPNKFITLGNSLLGISSLVLFNLDKPRSISDLWRYLFEKNQQVTFDQFLLSLDLLFLLGIINFSDNFIELLKIEEKVVDSSNKKFKEILDVFEMKNPDSQDPIIPYLNRLWEVYEYDIA